MEKNWKQLHNVNPTQLAVESVYYQKLYIIIPIYTPWSKTFNLQADLYTKNINHAFS